MAELTEGVPVELVVVVLAGALAIVQLLVAAGPRATAYGFAWAMGPRDERPPVEVSERAKRAERAYRNHLETYPVFAACALAVVMAGASSLLSEIGALIYLAGRLAYVPAYVFHVGMTRTLMWSVAMLGLAMVMLAVLLAAF